MLSTSLTALVFIRACIFGLRSVTPIAIACTAASILSRRHLFPWPLELYFGAETAFYLCWYLPWKRRLERVYISYPHAVPSDHSADVSTRAARSTPSRPSTHRTPKAIREMPRDRRVAGIVPVRVVPRRRPRNDPQGELGAVLDVGVSGPRYNARRGLGGGQGTEVLCR